MAISKGQKKEMMLTTWNPKEKAAFKRKQKAAEKRLSERLEAFKKNQKKDG